MRHQEKLNKFRGKPCVVCRKPSDPAHIKTRGSGGPDEEDNLLSLCRMHHSEQHQVGWVRFARKYRQVEFVLGQKGWEIRGEFGLARLVRFTESE